MQEVDLSQFNDDEKTLEILAEEGSEIIDEVITLLLARKMSAVIKSKSKLNRFGLNHEHHVLKIPALEHLENEIGDALALVDILDHRKLLSKERIEAAKQRKLRKLEIWYHKNS